MIGARGGHSGGDIAAGRANAIKVLARALGSVPELRIASLAGGASRNAIPREAVAVVLAGAAAAASARERIEAAGAEAASAFRTTDPGVHIDVTAVADGPAPRGLDRPAATAARGAAAADGAPPADAWPAGPAPASSTC